jgi:hypothetical protein
LDRHETNKQLAQQEQDRKQAMKQHMNNQPRRGGDDNKLYRWINDPKLSQAEREDPNTVLLELKDFQEGVKQTHGFFSNIAPEDILAQLTEKMKEELQEFKISNTHWRLNFDVKKQINKQPGEDDEEEDEEENKEDFVPIYEQAHIQFEILKVPDRQNIVYVQFKRKGGAAILFYDKSKKYLDLLHLFNNVTLEEAESQ